MSELNKYTRNFCIELYPDNTEHSKAIEKIFNNELCTNYRYCGIIHDKDLFLDTNESHKEGDLKKAHYHFVISTKSAKTRFQIAKRLGIDERFVEPCEKIKGSLTYLVHLNVPDKYQYDCSRLVGDIDYIAYIVEQVNKENINKNISFKILNDFIKNYNGYLSFTEFNEYAYKCGCLQQLKTCQLFFKSAIDEHNNMLKKCKV